MLNKLALRNAGRLWKDYLNYFLTLCMITALAFSFHSLLFSKDIYEMIHYGNNGELSTAGTMLITFMSISTAAIFIIVAWMINYMTRFILEKRSREFAVYLLSGMKKEQIASLYMKENFYLGLCALFAGLIFGSGLQQALFFIFYKSIGKNYDFVKQSPQAYLSALILTVILYGACLIAALLRNKKQFSRMEIIGLINMDKQNEIVNEKRNAIWQKLFFLSAGNILLLYFLIFTGRLTKWTAILEMIGLTFTFYFFYLGLSAFLMNYIKRKGRLIYKKEYLFLIRQFSSKTRNTCFVLGTLSLLFMLALVGSSLAFMLSDYQNRQLDVEYPFDIIMISDDTGYDFSKEEILINDNITPRDIWKYCVWQNGTSDMGDYLYQNLRLFSDRESAEGKRAVAYYDYDVYMGVSDYNNLRIMLGLTPVTLRDNQYLIHIPNRVYQEIEDKGVQLQNSLHIGLDFAGIQTEGFAQNGHNGADYLLVVPDQKLMRMKKYFSLMAVMASGNVPEDLSESLYDLAGKTRGYDELADYIRIGSEELFLMPATIQVKSREVLELKFLMSTLSFPLFYTGLVFLCISLTVLSVQQLSDSNKYRFRYQILNKLGLGKRKIRVVVLKQLFLYYLCPVIFSVIISAVFILYIGQQFVTHTGIRTEWIYYFGISLLGFLGIYIFYFMLTYMQFVKNIALCECVIST
ncbi:MAG: ABC transporter permease [Lachnospiraceae bacterium]|nr:ABC transporter permease [Lachnospiraceae bacterium]